MSGGIFLRESFETSWLTGSLFNDSRQIYPYGIDRVFFRSPAYLGEAIKFSSEVVYCDDTYFRIKTVVNKLGVEGLPSQVLSVMNSTFKFSESQEGVKKQLVPHTYKEALKFVKAKKELESLNL